MREWTFDEAVAVVTKAIESSQLAKDIELQEDEADELARAIVTALEETP